MFPRDARRVWSIGLRITDARREGDRDKELSYRKRGEATVEQFGSDAQREIEAGRRDQLRDNRGQADAGQAPWPGSFGAPAPLSHTRSGLRLGLACDPR